MSSIKPNTQPQIERASEQFARHLVTRLDADLQDLDAQTQERLRAARVRAVAARGTSKTTVLSQGNGSAALAQSAWRLPLSLGLAFLLLLSAIWWTQQSGWNGSAMNNARHLAETETEMLLDDVPPLAYADMGFLAYLEQESGSITDSPSY